MEFSFSKEPGIVLMNHLISMLPMGVEIQVYFSSKTGSVYKSIYKNGNTTINEIDEDEELNKVFEIRKFRKNPYSWVLSPEQLNFFKNTASNSIQFSLQNENEHLVLSMRFNSIFDKNNDVVYLNFREDMSFFGIDGGQIKMNTDNKAIIANLLYKSCISILNQSQNDYNALEQFTTKTKTAISNSKQYKSQLKQLREDHNKNIVSIAQSFIQNLSKKYCIDFIFTDECINALKDFSSNLPRLQNIVENAALYAYNLNAFSKKGTVIIEEEYLEIGHSDISSKSNSAIKVSKTGIKLNRKERAEIMLNKIELAVKTVMANKERVTGINVGKAFEKPISAAAITDYLKKHFNEVNEILAENPSKFPEARANFKPLINIIPYNSKIKSA